MKHAPLFLVRIFWILALLGLGVGVLYCGGGEGESLVVPPDKTDNFIASKAQEYMLEGTTTVTLEESLATASEDTKLKRVHELIPLKQVVIGWFLNAYLVGKDSHSSNQSYGGFDCLTKNGSYEELDIQPTTDGGGLTYSFKFRQEVGGPLDLLSNLTTTNGADGKKHFSLTIGKISNEDMNRLETNYEWYRDSPWSDFDPSKVDASRLEQVDLAIWAEPRSNDGWIDTNALFKDGQITIGVHFGWDYHSEYHLKHSKEVYDWLIDQGFKSPVSGYDKYTRSSGPLQKTLKANGQSLTAKIWLFWGKPGTETDPDTDAGGIVLENDMEQSFKDREVIIFSGHSGPFYGFALANWKKTSEGDLDDADIPLLDMPQDVYQVVLAEGCETYGLGQAFWENPNKADRKNLDVLTTTNFSNAGTASTVTDFLTAFIGTDSSGNQVAKTFLELIEDLDSNSYWFNTMYGVHGIDDNPHLHPFVDTQKFCTACTSDSACGPQGYKCSRLNSAEKACFGRCTADDGCPEGWKCMDIASGTTMKWKACVPSNLTCTQEPPQPSKPTVMINEILADPPDGLAGDANADGTRDASKDEFVELYNFGDALVDLEGLTLSDSSSTRMVFAKGATLLSHQALVIFGGGSPAAMLSGSSTYKSTSGLGLNNTGDTLTLTAKDKTVLDQVTYGGEGGNDRSLVRQTDGDPTAPFVAHPGTPYSAGTRQDGSPF
jgi:hypothetical protein